MIIRRSVTYVIISIIALSSFIFWGLFQLSRGDSFGIIMILVGIVLVTITYWSGVRDKNPRVIIDDEGISATEFHINKIYWEDIKAVKMIIYPHAGRIITFELYDESKYTGFSSGNQEQVSGFNISRLFGLPRFCIMVDGLDVSPRRIYQEITSHIITQPPDDFS